MITFSRVEKTAVPICKYCVVEWLCMVSSLTSRGFGHVPSGEAVEA
jgi:hypothetical protein